MTIGTLSARILMDASGVKAGMGLTRAEMRLTRQAFIDSKSDVEKLEAALATLESARAKGAFRDEEQYAAALAAVRSELDPVVQAERDRAAAVEAAAAAEAAAQQQAMQRGQALADSLATSDERRAKRLAEANELLTQGAINQQTYNRAVAQLDAEKFKELGASIRNAAAAAAAAAGAISAGLTLIGKDLLAAYAEEESAARKLQGAMQANESYSAAAFTRYKQFASGLQQITTVGDEATIAMLQQAESLQVTGEAAERATRNAIGLQAALGLDARSSMKMTSALEQGNTTLLTRYLPALRAIEDPAQRAAAAQEALGRMFGVATAEVDTYAGAAAQLANAWGDVKEQFGAVLADALMPVLDVGRDVVAWLAEMDDGTRQTAVYVGMATAGLGAFVAAGASVVAVVGQMTIWYGALQTSAIGAKVAQLALNSAVGVGYVAAAGAALVIGYKVGEMLVNQTQWAQDAKAAYAEYAAGVAALQSREAKQREQTLSALRQAPPDMRTGALDSEMSMAQKQLDGLTARTAMAKEEMDRLQPSWLSLGQAGKAVWEAQKAEYESLKDRAAAAGEWVNTLEGEMRKLGNAGPTEAAIDAVDKLTTSLREQIATAGMSADAVEQWKLQTEGATAAQINAVAALQRQAAAARETTALRADTDKLVESLQLQIDTVGKTEAEVQRLQLAARGLSPEWMRVVEAMQSRLEVAQQAEEVRQEVERLSGALREQIATAGMSAEQVEVWKLANAGATQEQIAQVDALQRQAAAVREQQAAQQAAADAAKNLQDSLAATTKRLQEQIATAGMSTDQLELWRLAQQGATPQQLAQVGALQAQAKAARDDAKAIADATKAQKDQIDTTRDWNAATRGSSEALERVEAYRRMQAADAAEVAKAKAGLLPSAAMPTAPFAAPEVPAMGAPIQPAWESTPSPPAVPPVPAEIQAAWADILQLQSVSGMEAEIASNWLPLPAAPAVPDMASGIQPTWQPTPPAPSPTGVAAPIQSAWQPIPDPPAVPPIEVDLVGTWTPLPPAPGMPPGESPPASSVTREYERPAATASTAASPSVSPSRSDAYLSQAVALLGRIAAAAEEDRIVVEEVH